MNDDRSEVESPCRSICKLDSHNICIGCYRKSSEINFWTTYSNQQKLEVIERAEARRMETEKETPYSNN
jgi:uncharacterized protein